MSINSSSNFSLHPASETCIYPETKTMFAVFSVANFLLLPLFLSVLYLGCRRWKRSPAAVTSHSDVFAYNMVVLELIGIVGTCFYCSGIYAHQPDLVLVMKYLASVVQPGQTLFHTLTCVERYLAVVHPVTYLGLRQSGGVRIRNVAIFCVWLLCPAMLSLPKLLGLQFITISAVLLAVSSAVVSFCSLSVLCILIRPRPGAGGGNGERVDQLKQRAFHTIMAIMGALLLSFLSSLVTCVAMLSAPSSYVTCLVGLSSYWFHLPSSLVLRCCSCRGQENYQSVNKRLLEINLIR